MSKKTDIPSGDETPASEAPPEGTDPTPSQGSPTSVSEPSGSEPATATSTSVEAIAATLISEAPEPQPNAISQANDERAQKAADQLDDEGTAFDSAIHTGTKTAGGAWRKKSGRKPSVPGGSANGGAGNTGASRPKLNLPGGSGASAGAPNTKVVNARAGGTTAANLLIMLSVGIGGAEWLPRQPPIIPYDEKAALEGAFADYFEAKGWEDLPPGWALVAGIGMYALPRFTMPRTQERAKGFKNWIAGKYINWKAKRAKKAAAKRWGPEKTTDIEKADADARRRYAEETRDAA